MSDAMLAEVQRAISERRDAVLPSDADLATQATVRRSDVDAAVDFFREAVAGSGLETLLDGPAREDERDG